MVDLERSLKFYCEGLGFTLLRRNDYPDGRFTLAFLQAPGDTATDPDHCGLIELTHNWDTTEYTRGDAYGHVAYAVDSIDAIQSRLKQHGFDLSWGPGLTPDKKTKMAFIDDPDGYEIELLERQL